MKATPFSRKGTGMKKISWTASDRMVSHIQGWSLGGSKASTKYAMGETTI